jgi:glycosyltransferase involved in cell wall biosynthesis
MMPRVSEDPLRLAFVADPNSIHTRHWLGFFVERNHRVFLLDGFGAEIAPGLDPRIQIERYVAHPGPRLPLVSLLRGRAALRRLLRQLQPDVLHALFVRRYGWQAALSGFHPLVVTPWGSDLLLESLRTRRVRAWDRRALRGAELVTYLSTPLREAAIAAGADPARLVSIQEGVDTERFAPGPPDPTLAERLRLDGRLVFSPRAVRPLYRQELVLRAFAGLPPDTALLLSAHNADRGYLGMLYEEAEHLRVADRLRVVESLDEAGMVAAYRLADLVVSVPASDGRPVSVMEAMACGVPVVAGDLPAVRELLGEISPELLIAGDDAAQLADAMRRALELDEATRQRLGAALREHVVRTSDWRMNMGRMEELYRELARSS